MNAKNDVFIEANTLPTTLHAPRMRTHNAMPRADNNNYTMRSSLYNVST